jgi:hypothetical protein
MSEAKIDEFPCLFPASRVLEFQRRVRSRLQKKLPAGYTIEAGGTVEESAKGLRSIALISRRTVSQRPPAAAGVLESLLRKNHEADTTRRQGILQPPRPA